ncbi:hypothetical protein [Microcoleus vaginatus]|uniref:hypothetical protein n=1 Tax=Microcoleus vaginatus TaxID=119532 RepID=UPI001F61EA86|nr:hypothetical protein D0A37_26410 [Microcoleus vaginatus HSN003]
MRASLEMRWFYSGALPKSLNQWFGSESLGAYLSPPEEREDIYLLVPNCDYLGVKLRGKTLEVKWRQAELGTMQFANRWEGKAEKWLKWVCADTMAPIPADIVATGKWVGVKKKRAQRLYQVSAPGSLMPVMSVPVEAPIPQGCTVELTQLNINGSAWWTLGFEAFGSESCLTESLETVASWTSKSYQAQKLKAEDSSAYPIWLGSK